ncbi:MAG: TrkH family potassium uptake protein [Anaerovoracaceae bacterium]|jgi:trk system potassium uptake protein TrkH
MVLNFRLILKIVAIVIVIVALAMIPSFVVAILYGEYSTGIAFLKSIIPILSIGLLLTYFSKPSRLTIRIRDGLLIVGLSWILAALCSAIPFFISGSIPNFADAFFECASGYSTTGATILPDIESLPKSMLFWRSFTHWLGGMGILIFAIAILPSLGIGGVRIADAESPGPTLDKITPKMSDTAKILYFMYFGMTLIETILLLLGGMNLFDALIHSFGSVATGGFSSYNNSIAHFDSLYIEIVITFFMVMAGVNFTLYYMVLQGNWKDFFRDQELRAYFSIIGVSIILITIILFIFNTCESIFEGLRLSVFQVASIITTTGFSTTDFNLWPSACKFILFLLMLIGGCSASTSGAIKVVRIVIFFKLIRRGFYKRLHSKAVVPIKLNDKNVPSDTVSNIVSFIFLYISLFLIGTFIVCLENVDLITAATSVATCLGNVGPGFEMIGPLSNFSLFSNPTTVLLGFFMIAGRLELFTLLLLLSPSFWNPDR